MSLIFFWFDCLWTKRSFIETWRWSLNRLFVGVWKGIDIVPDGIDLESTGLSGKDQGWERFFKMNGKFGDADTKNDLGPTLQWLWKISCNFGISVRDVRFIVIEFAIGILKSSANLQRKGLYFIFKLEPANLYISQELWFIYLSFWLPQDDFHWTMSLRPSHYLPGQLSSAFLWGILSLQLHSSAGELWFE